MKITILGGGFGLYGYLLALVKFNNFSIILPKRYQKYFQTRDDIRPFYNNVEWANNDEDLLAFCEGVIIALPPTQQYIWAKRCLNYKHITHILLEKPLAVTPNLAVDLIKDLEISGKKFRIAYNFRYTDWGEAIIRNASSIESISWNFQAHHYAQNIQTWKRQHKKGGGALRFYGIHLIALLSELGYSNVVYSEIKAKQQDEAETWYAEISGRALSPCVINLATNSKVTDFIVRSRKGYNYSFLHPFQTMSTRDSLTDQRIPILVKLFHDLFYDKKIYYDWYSAVNLLWDAIEQRILLQ